MVSPLQNAVNFLKEFGLFDVVLPFLLVFTIVFAILEKTRILGTTNTKEKDPKKSLDGMVAFVIAMLVVATNKIVTAINSALPNVVFLVIISVSFLLLVSVFLGTGELDFNKQFGGWTVGFMIVLLILIVLIFLNSLTLNNGDSWLEYGAKYFYNNISGPIVTSLIFLAIAVAAIFFVVGGKNGGGKDK